MSSDPLLQPFQLKHLTLRNRLMSKANIAGGLCERELPPMRKLAEGHGILCHLPDEALKEMQPVFSRDHRHCERSEATQGPRPAAS